LDIIELYNLSEWYNRYYQRLNNLYNALSGTLNHNASQPNQQPIEENLQRLITFLSEMNTAELSLQQIDLLGRLEVESWIGEIGADHLERVVKTASYDPASTAGRIQAAIQKLGEAQQKLRAYAASVSSLNIPQDEFHQVMGRVIVRVGFKNEASIDNIVEWKDSAEDWNHIIRGIALTVGEAPEETQVIGATKGSLILILAATYAVTKILSLITRHLANAARDVISVGDAIEDLRQKRLLTSTIEKELNKKKEDIKKERISELKAELKKLSKKRASGEDDNALDQSIERLFKFGEAGGDVDFVAPASDEEAQEAGEEEPEVNADESMNEIKEVRQLIRDYQEVREAVRLIENKTGK
jgi:Na+/phosphate symporter